MESRATSSPPNTPGSSRPLMATTTPSSAQTRSVISFWPTMVELISTWTMYDYLARNGRICYRYSNSHQGCHRRLDPLLAYPAWVRRTVPTGISNNVMGSVPQHPFFLRVIQMLQQHDHHWALPYITIMYSTGPLFLSVVWKEYIQDDPSESNRVRILMQEEYQEYSWSFFTHHIGSSWHGKDAHFIFWVSIF